MKKTSSNYYTRPALEEDMPWIEERIRKEGLDDEELYFNEFLVLEDEKGKVAFGRLKPYPDFYEIADLYVDVAKRGKGIGSYLLRNLMEQNPGAPLYAITPDPSFFERHGFEKTSDIPLELYSKVARFYGPKRIKPFVMRLRVSF